VVYEYANHRIRNGRAATIVYLQEPLRPSSHRAPLALRSWLDRHRSQLGYKLRTQEHLIRSTQGRKAGEGN